VVSHKKLIKVAVIFWIQIMFVHCISMPTSPKHDRLRESLAKCNDFYFWDTTLGIFINGGIT
jgi:hypothetical protein